MTPYTYETTGRNRSTLITLVVIWVAILLAIAIFDAALWLMAVLMLFTGPALYDLISGRRSGIRIDRGGLTWFSGRRTGEIALDRIEHIRLDTRLDLSVRASAVLTSGRKVRLPLETTPPPDQFEAALKACGIGVKRHHFSLLG